MIDALDSDLAEILEDCGHPAVFRPGMPGEVSCAAVLGDIGATGATGRAAAGDDSTLSLTVPKAPFAGSGAPVPGTPFRFADGRAFRVTECATTPDDAAFALVAVRRQHLQ